MAARRRRRRRRNPGGVLAFAMAHPYLTTFFVLPAVIGLPIAVIRALAPKREMTREEILALPGP
jgi:hypothetical protein